MRITRCVAVVSLAVVATVLVRVPDVAAKEPGAREAALALNQPTRWRIQEGLRNEGFDPGPPDGVFGPRTRAAIGAWQTARDYAATEFLDREQAEFLRMAGGGRPAVASGDAEGRIGLAEASPTATVDAPEPERLRGLPMGYVTVATTGMSIVMALLLGRAATAAAVLLEVGVSKKTQRHGAAVLILTTIFFVLVGAVMTITYAHQELGLDYLPVYVFISLVGVVLPLHIATECVYRAAVHSSALRQSVNDGMVKAGMRALFVGVFSLFGYVACIVWFAWERWYNFIMILAFNVLGLVFIVWFLKKMGNSAWFVGLAIASCVAALAYLLALWAFNIRMAPGT